MSYTELQNIPIFPMLKEAPGTAVTLIGNKGGGKNTLISLVSSIVQQTSPQVQQWSNTPMKGCNYEEDIVQFLATKLILQDRRKIEAYIDEAAIAGFEARGSGMKAAATRSYLITLSRKAHADLWFLTQLMSMVDKRAQWLADFYILCKSHHTKESFPYPAYFEYTVYDENLKWCNEFYLHGELAKRYLYGRFDTDHIPFLNNLIEMFREVFGIDRAVEEAYKIKTGLTP